MQGQELADDPCIRKLACKYCELLTPEQIVQLPKPTYKLRKEKQKERDSLVDPSLSKPCSFVDMPQWLYQML